MTRPIGNLLFDSISRNTGDIAIGIAGQQMLDSVGISGRIIDPFSRALPSRLIVGGGELIRPTGDPFYDTFRPKGQHVLNAVGVWSSADALDYLNDYAFVSARSEREREVLGRWVPEAQVVPCATTLLQSPTYTIPGVEQGEPVVGIHVVPHSLRLIEELIPLIDAIPHKKVFIPFTHYNGDASFMRNMPFDRENTIFLDHLEPLELHSVLGQMSYSIVSSLHASIFSYSQNVPFVSIHQKKVEYYFTDRGLRSSVVSTAKELLEQVDRIEVERPDYTAQLVRDREAVQSAFENYAGLLASIQVSSSEWIPGPVLPSRHQDEILLAQAQHVIGDRDLVLAYSESRLIQAKRDARDLAARLNQITIERDALRRLRVVRMLAKVMAIRRSVVRMLSAVFKRS